MVDDGLVRVCGAVGQNGDRHTHIVQKLALVSLQRFMPDSVAVGLEERRREGLQQARRRVLRDLGHSIDLGLPGAGDD